MIVTLEAGAVVPTPTLPWLVIVTRVACAVPKSRLDELW